MKKLKALFGGLGDTKTSEFWMMWGGVGLTILGFIPGFKEAIVSVAATVGVDPAVLVGGMLVYAVGRMTSKAAKAG